MSCLRPTEPRAPLLLLPRLAALSADRAAAARLLRAASVAAAAVVSSRCGQPAMPGYDNFSLTANLLQHIREAKKDYAEGPLAAQLAEEKRNRQD